MVEQVAIQTVREVGTVLSIRYQRSQSNWGIARVRFAEKVYWIKGEIFPLTIGAQYEFEGVWEEDSHWGKGLRAQSRWEVIPRDPEGLTRYLLSLRLAGLNPVLCLRLVARWGDACLQILEEEPERLVELGVSEGRARQIGGAWNRRFPSRSLLITPQKWGLTEHQARALYNQYEGRATEILRRNPYEIAEQEGIGFRTADGVAQRAGISRQDPRRVRAALRHILRSAAHSEGHTALPRTEMLARVRGRHIDLESELAQEILQSMEEEKEFLSEPEGSSLGLEELVKKEREISAGLLTLAARVHSRKAPLPDLRLNSQQARAVQAVHERGLLILTGCPGTGKTFTLREILRGEWENPQLAAPTGKAAKRLTEMTGIEALTLHRLLEYHPAGDTFGRGPQRLLESDLVLVDEAAMLDVPLAHALIQAIDPRRTTLVLAGDADQLPPVGPGNFLGDAIGSERLPVVRLTEVVRQGAGSQIVHNANLVLQGEPILVDNDNFCDFKFFPVEASTQLLERKSFVSSLRDLLHILTKEMEYSTQDIQILSPMKRGPVPGSRALNEMLQNLLNPSRPYLTETKVEGQLFRLSDRVIQTRNDYERGVFNGDTGTIIDLSSNRVVVDFKSGRIVSYEDAELRHLELAYALSVHKSQGSEWPVVIVPLSLAHKSMLSRRLFYTAMTRARKLVILLGTEKAIATCIANNDEDDRVTTLASWLRHELPPSTIEVEGFQLNTTAKEAQTETDEPITKKASTTKEEDQQKEKRGAEDAVTAEETVLPELLLTQKNSPSPNMASSATKSPPPLPNETNEQNAE